MIRVIKIGENIKFSGATDVYQCQDTEHMECRKLQEELADLKSRALTFQPSQNQSLDNYILEELSRCIETEKWKNTVRLHRNRANVRKSLEYAREYGLNGFANAIARVTKSELARMDPLKNTSPLAILKGTQAFRPLQNLFDEGLPPLASELVIENWFSRLALTMTQTALRLVNELHLSDVQSLQVQDFAWYRAAFIAIHFVYLQNKYTESFRRDFPNFAHGHWTLEWFTLNDVTKRAKTDQSTTFESFNTLFWNLVKREQNSKKKLNSVKI